MTTQIHEKELAFSHPTRYLVRPPAEDKEEPAPVVMALHGFGMTATEFLEGLSSLDASRAILLVPEGPYPVPPLRRGSEKIGYSWYVYHRNDPDGFGAELRRGEEHLMRILDEVEEGHAVDRTRSVLLGFSQGGYLAGFVGVRQAHRFGGLVLASARLKHELLTEELAEGSLPRTLVVHSPDDTLVEWPPQEQSIRRFQEAGGEVEVVLHDHGHRLPPPALRRISKWMHHSNLVAPSATLP